MEILAGTVQGRRAGAGQALTHPCLHLGQVKIKVLLPPYILGAHAGTQALAWDGVQQEQRAPVQLYAESSSLLPFVLWVRTMSKNDTWTGQRGVSLLLA